MYLLPLELIDPARAGQLFAEAIACTERSGDRLISQHLHLNAGCHALLAGNIPAARAHLEQAAQLTHVIGESSHHVPTNLGWLLRQEGDPDGARSMFVAGLRISRRNGSLVGLASVSLGLACLAADLGDWRRAGELHGAAQALLDRTGHRWEEGEARYRRDSLGKVRTHLGEEQFNRVYAKGTTLSPEEAVEVVALGRDGTA